MKKRRHHCRK